MRTLRLGLSITGFLLIGVLSELYLFTQLGELDLHRAGGYTISADFSDASGLEPGSIVELAGVQVGQVTAISLIGTRARVMLRLRDDVQLPDDTIASIQTKGLLGGRYMLITPGGSERIIPPGGKIRETEAPLDLPGLLAAYIAQRDKKAAATSKTKGPATENDLSIHSPFEENEQHKKAEGEVQPE
jgi:phospholipid/cholesterol/gamma-HCH transport system substrate-binding protein